MEDKDVNKPSNPEENANNVAFQPETESHVDSESLTGNKDTPQEKNIVQQPPQADDSGLQTGNGVVAMDQIAENDPNTIDGDGEVDNTEKDKHNKAEYIAPLDNPYEKAWKYLYKHDILTLFQGLTANIVANKPVEPLDYMVDEIEKLQEQDRIRKGVIKRTKPEAEDTKES